MLQYGKLHHAASPRLPIIGPSQYVQFNGPPIHLSERQGMTLPPKACQRATHRMIALICSGGVPKPLQSPKTECDLLKVVLR